MTQYFRGLFTGVAALTLTGAMPPAMHAPLFPQCPPVGANSGCAILIVISSTGINVLTDPSQGPFDRIEDTMIGVQNNSGQTVFSLPLSGPNPIFSLDGDGICATATVPRPAGCPFGPTGYEGPGVSFASINATQKAGVINFTGGLPSGGTRYFALELSIQTLCNPINGVPLIKQFVAPWGSLPYDGGNSTGNEKIGGYGCYLTASAMLINYYAASQGSAFRTDPGQLDAWLTSASDGYNPPGSGALNGAAVARYAQSVGHLRMYYYGSVDHADDFTVDNFLCNNDPVILKVESSPGHTHFVAATGQTTIGQTGTFLINDPGFATSTLGDPRYNSLYLGIRKFSSQASPPNALVITGHSPIQLLLADGDGNQTGFNQATGEILHGIPASSYSAESLANDANPAGLITPDVKILEVMTPVAGTYHVTVLGTGVGSYSLGFLTYDLAGTPSTQTFRGATIPGAIAQFSVTYSPNVGSIPVIAHDVSIAAIIADVQSASRAGLIDNAGLVNSLLSKLAAAQVAFAAGNMQLANEVFGAFINEVAAQAGKHIESDAANLLTADAVGLMK
jgi:hypothetical protein